ncbi:MAG: type II secretion system F family protein [Phycisphaerales bacterium]|nr:MAG: type II secretion system F family protein [Phycisphaerales bacterium]
MSIYAIAVMIAFSLALIVYAMWPKGGEEQDTIKRRMSGKRTGLDEANAIRRRARETVTNRMVKRVAKQAMRPVMPADAAEMSKLRIRLANAGFRQDNATTMFLASKTVVALTAAVVAGLYSWAKGDTLGSMGGFVLFCGATGFMAPNFWLKMAAGKRQESVRNGIPDALDLMVISVESGLALDAAVQRVGDEMKTVHPVLAEEFQIVSLESQMGIPRSEALSNLAERTGVPEVRSLTAIVNQAEKFGTSIARALRTQADTLRTKRRQQAEERAQKTTVKLMVPLVLFIFPAILVVLGGPAALKMIETMRNTPGLF